MRMMIYEYKDDDTPIGAVIYDDKVKEIEELKLPRLRDDWHWRIHIIKDEEREFKDEQKRSN